MKKLLSREPTPEILSAIHGAICGEYNEEGFYNEIYNAAPALPEPGEVERKLRDYKTLRFISEATIEEAADLIATLQDEVRDDDIEIAHQRERAEKAEAELIAETQRRQDAQQQYREKHAECERLKKLAYHDEACTKTWKRAYEITNNELIAAIDAARKP